MLLLLIATVLEGSVGVLTRSSNNPLNKHFGFLTQQQQQQQQSKQEAGERWKKSCVCVLFAVVGG
jgi:hypothetical protein